MPDPRPPRPWLFGLTGIPYGVAGSFTGVEITYAPLAHLPRSMTRQRSLQNGNSASVRRTIFLQIGQRRLRVFFSIVRY